MERRVGKSKLVWNKREKKIETVRNNPHFSDKRKRFVQDDDGHWYLIDANKEQQFEFWMRWTNNPEGEGPEEDFDADRLAGGIEGITFVDPQED
jgi:hypothetical protein